MWRPGAERRWAMLGAVSAMPAAVLEAGTAAVVVDGGKRLCKVSFARGAG